MRNRISCSASDLKQLEPAMVQSVVGVQVFKLGNQYFNERRVRVLDADAIQVSAEVNGTFGVYSQTIKLRSGMLATKCTCPSSEQPFCRHCVAVLLQYYHDNASEELSQNGNEADGKSFSEEEGKIPLTSSDFNFRDVTVFIDWIQLALPAFGNGGPFPEIPALPPGAVRNWAEVIENVHQRFLKDEADRNEAQSNLQIAQERIEELTHSLEEARLKEKDAAEKGVGLQAEIEKCKAMVADFSMVSQERDRLADEANGLRDELQGKCTELNTLSSSIKELAQSIQGLLPPRPS